MNNYNNLYEYLVENNNDEVILSYIDFELELNIKLPAFVYKYPNRFFYNDNSNSYYRHWGQAGYSAYPNKKENLVKFVKQGIVNNDVEILKNNKNKKTKDNEIFTISNEKINEIHNIVLHTSNYGEEIKLINKIFNRFRNNTSVEEIAIKIAIIDITNSTQISKYKKYLSLNDVANIIYNIRDFDSRVAIGDETLVDEIARKSKEMYGINLFSFASKYCCYHNIEIYQRDDYSIYDSIVAENLTHYSNKIIKSDVKKCRTTINYHLYNTIIRDILDSNNITTQNRRRKFDHYIWYTNKIKNQDH